MFQYGLYTSGRRLVISDGVSVEALTQWQEATVGSLLSQALNRWPDRAAIRWPTPTGLKTLTWKQVWDSAASGAAQLRADDPTPIAIFAPNSEGWYLSLWAVALSGRPLVPINPALTEREVRAILMDSGASIVLAARDYRGRNLLEAVARLNIVDIQHLWDVDDWISATQSGTDAIGEAAPQSTFVIQYTSGTTGTPKGVMLAHRACVNAASTLIATLEPGDHETCCSPSALHHVGALIAHALALARIGATYVMMNEFSAQGFVEAAASSRATILAGVPTMYSRVLDDRSLADVKLPDVRVLMLGGASIPVTLVSRLESHFRARVAVMYGQSEAPVITATRLDDPAWMKAHTVGRALPHREIQILGVATRSPADVGQIGEICVRTPVRMVGYLNLPDATSKAIDDEGWLHTGDLGALDIEGRLYFHGRLREMIVRGGENIYAREVEEVIESHPRVAEVAVVGLPDSDWGEIVAAAVVPRTGATVSTDELSAWVERHLARYKRPTSWRFVDELPMTASGKPKKFAIVEWFGAIDGN